MPSINHGQSTDEQLIKELYETGDRALMSADVDALSHILGDDYIQYGDTGKPESRQTIRFHRTHDSDFRRHCGGPRIRIG